MIASLRRLFKHSAIYGLGSVLNNIIGFILLPLYTRYLTTFDYGINSLLMTTTSVVTIFAQMGIGSAIFREVIYEGRDESEVESTALYYLLLQSGLFFGALILFSDQISNLIFGPDSQAYLLRLTFLTGFLQMVQIVFMARLRIREQSSLYSAITVIRFLVGTGLNIYYVAVLERGVEGLVMASLITRVLITLVCLALMIKHLKLRFSLPALQGMLRFSAPLVPGNLASMLMTSADRYFLQHYSGAEEVGLYSLGYKIGLVMNLIVQSVQLAWPAQMFEIMKEADAERKFSRILTIYVVGLGFISLGFSVLAREMLVVMTTPDFYSAARVVPLVLISYLFYGVRFMTNNGLVRENKLKYASLVIMGTAVISLGLNYWLIPRYGMMGAAWSTLISYGILLIAHMIVNQRFWRISYEYWRMAKVGLVWALIYVASLQVTSSNIIWSIFLKGLLLLSYPVLLYLIRFFKQDELHTLKGIILTRTRKLEHLWKTEE